MVLPTRNTKSVWGLAKLSTRVVVVALLSLFGAASAAAQAAIVSGSVLDADFGGGVVGARVSLLGTDLSATTDLEGRFVLAGVPEGEYTLIASATYFKSSQVEALKIESDGVVKVNVPLYGDDSDIIELDSFTVTAEVLESSDLGLMSQRQKSAAFSDAIGAESFSRLGLGDAADAMSKVTGASIVDGKYVVVRGLADRYNNTMLDGAVVPSSDPNRKSVQLDQFPSSLIDVIATTKTFTPDQSGEFTGGSVNIQTKSFPERFFAKVGFGISHNEYTSGKDILTYTGGGDDWLGKDDGTRALPEIAKDPENLKTGTRNGSPLEVLDEVINSFSPEVSPYRVSAPMNSSWSLSFGDSKYFSNDRKFGYVASLTYGRSFSNRQDGQEIRYEVERNTLTAVNDMAYEESKNDVNVGALLNMAYQFSPKHEIGLKNFYNQSGIDRASWLQGEVTDSDTLFLRETRLHFTERNVTQNKLYGKHAFGESGGISLDWDYSVSSSSQDEPDYRLFFDSIPLDAVDDPDPNWSFPTGLQNVRWFRDLSEDNTEYGFNAELPFFKSDSSKKRTLKFGYRKIESDRDYHKSAFKYDVDRSRGKFVVYDGDRDNYLNPETMGFDSNGDLRLIIVGFNDGVGGYRGNREIESLYAMSDFSITDRIRVIGGARQEKTKIEVQSFDSTGEDLEFAFAEVEDDQWLPGANVVWSLTDKQNIRFGASKTVARPNFRELSPVADYDTIASKKIVGNSDLKMTEIDNLDLRWEWFYGDSEILAFSVFQKNLGFPIEQTISQYGDVTWVNVEDGEVRGFEVEASKELPWLSGEYSSLRLGGNASFIDSEVTRPALEIGVIDDAPTRELQGQSSVIYNIDLSYQHYRKGTGVTLAFNHTGERLDAVTIARDMPDIYELPGDSLDLIFSQRFAEKWSVKFKAANLLDEASRSVLTNINEDAEELIYSSAKTGTTYSLSFSYDIK